MATRAADTLPGDTDSLRKISCVLQQLDSMIQKGKTHTDTDILSDVNILRHLLEAPEEVWAVTVGDEYKKLYTTIETFKRDLQQLEVERKVSKELDPCEVLANASSGLALKGILLGAGAEKVYIKRQILRNVPDAKFSLPSEKQINEVREFTSEDQLDHFNENLEKLGYRAALGETDRAQYHRSVSQEGDEFYGRIKMSIVPTAALELNVNSLRLVPEAVDELKLLESGIGCNDEQAIAKKCEYFFKIYGSHVNVGLVHFGGVSKVEGTYFNNKKPTPNAKLMVTDLVNVCASLDYSGRQSAVSNVRSARRWCTASQTRLLDTYDCSHLEDVHIHITRTGHLYNAKLCSLPFWKLGLATVNRRWELIDRERTVGIWRLISNHREDFKNAEALSAMVEQAWNGRKFFLLKNVQVSAKTEAMLKKLGLVNYFPGKISIQQVMCVRDPWRPGQTAELPWQLLQKLLMMNYEARDQLVSDFNNRGKKTTTTSLAQLASFEKKDDNSKLNPMDVLLLTFECCDRFLQQMLAQKLQECQLAVPYLYPHGSPENLVLSLWALRTIVIEWRNVEGKSIESSVTSVPLSVISFIRLGSPPLSKSKLINHVLRNDCHDTFFHRDCPSGTAQRSLADGLVECTWFLPAGKKNETFSEATVLLNLRGDGSLLHTQITMLSRVTSTMVVITNGEDIDDDSQLCVLNQLCETDMKIVVLLAAKAPTLDLSKLHNVLQHKIGNERINKLNFILGFEDGRLRNLSDLKEEVGQVLSGTSTRRLKMEEQVDLAGHEGVTIDENDHDCLDGKRLAQDVVKLMESNGTSCKTSLLPLQGTPWLGYSELLKKQHRAGRSSPLTTREEVNQLEEQMHQLRKDQTKLCIQPGSFVERFILNLKESIKDSTTSKYFLQWLKTLLDEKSRVHIPALRRKYSDLWTRFQTQKWRPGKPENRIYLDALVDAEKKLVDAGFGLEHIFREVGQMYEAIKECDYQTDSRLINLIEGLPKIVSQLLLEGHPLELVDGDASNIPVTWIKAVLKNVRDLIGKKKLFVLSVLGIQGSGKSTLLNTMFGLQFAVSAGRCTRGAFMQLVPVAKQTNRPFDYIAVVDTEGLRAPELADLNHEHDNELATLTIGLADVTLVNIQGENTAEMNDFLQIAVHALMRMRLVRKQTQACMFLHQNVSAISAKDKMILGRQKLHETLDIKAREAAEQESIFDVNSFSQLIAFDVEKHAHYFSTLWRGDPPMAPANPGYSLATESVKTVLIEDIAMCQGTHLSVMDLSRRVEDLWSGILSDDFVFCFRNSLEIKVYNRMEAKYHELKWEFESAIDNWLQKTAEVKLFSCESEDALDQVFLDLHGDLEAKVGKELKNAILALDEYFEKSEKRDVLIQWQGSKQTAVKTVAVQKRSQGLKLLKEVVDTCKIQLMERKVSDDHISHVMKKAVELADRYQNKNPSDLELQKEFDAIWKSLLPVKAISKDLAEDVPVHAVVEQQLREYLPEAYRLCLQKELTVRPLNDLAAYSTLEGSLGKEDVSKDDLGIKRSFETVRLAVRNLIRFTSSPFKHAQRHTHSITQGILQEINEDLSRLRSQNVKLQIQHHATEVIRKVTFRFDKHNEEARKGEHPFTIKDSYIVKVVVHICRFCVQVFDIIQKEYKERHGAVAKLERYKNAHWQVFETKIKQRRWEAVAADVFCDALKDVVETAVRNEIHQRVVHDMIARFGYSKFYLIVDILENLAKEEDFSLYVSYVRDARGYASIWITDLTNKEMFVNRKFEAFAREALKRHVTHITAGVKEATDTVRLDPEPGGQADGRMDRWTDIFCKAVQKSLSLRVTKNTLRLLVQMKVKDFENMTSKIEPKLQEMMQTLVDEFKSQDHTSVKWEDVTPYEQIMERLWGCPKQCPFCEEPCSNTSEDHYPNVPHRCVQHKPQGVVGFHWESTQDLSVQTCNYAVQTGAEFKCKVNNYSCRTYGGCTTKGEEWVWHPYRHYHKYIADWDIAPSPANAVSKYWMWFMAKYQHQLKEYYQKGLPRVPEIWHRVSKVEAIANLRDYFAEDTSPPFSSSPVDPNLFDE